jgi:hypothetical protein
MTGRLAGEGVTSLIENKTPECPPVTFKRAVKPRICMPTGRSFTKRAFLGGHYEAQDVLLEIDDVDLIELEAGRRFEFKEGLQRRLLYRDVSRKIAFLNPGLRKVRLTREYELFLVRCQTYWDLLYINAVEGWKDYCKTSVLWLDELWAASLPEHKYWLPTLKQFDHVFIGYRGTVGPLSATVGRSCHWLPGGVDCLRFSPWPEPPSRVVDVYSVGRRWEGIHGALLKAAGAGHIFYIYDTLPRLAERDVYDHRQHRSLFANVAKRSRYFMVAPGKMNSHDETHGQVEVGYRYYEGAAAGAVLLGQAPDCEAFRELFPWHDVVIEVQADGSDVMEVMESLDADPARVRAIRQRNSAEALLRHDWAYRWKEIFRVAGIGPMPAMEARERRLKDLADMATNTQ